MESSSPQNVDSIFDLSTEWQLKQLSIGCLVQVFLITEIEKNDKN